MSSLELSCLQVTAMAKVMNLAVDQAAPANGDCKLDFKSRLQSKSDSEMVENEEFPPQALHRLQKSYATSVVAGKEVAMLRQDLRAALNDPKYSDLRFVCKDGREVYASRLILVARCPMLKGMLSNGMAESKMDKIEMPTVTSAAMLAALEFLYTGNIETHQLIWLSAFDTIRTARYFLMDRLRDYVMNDLIYSVGVDMDCKFVTWCFTQMADSGISGGKHLLLHPKSAELVAKLVSKMPKLDPYLTNSFSLSAFNLYLDATESVNDTNTSFKEYLRLRRILLWACTKVSPVIEGTLRRYMPDEKWLRKHTLDALKEHKRIFLLFFKRPVLILGCKSGHG